MQNLLLIAKLHKRLNNDLALLEPFNDRTVKDLLPKYLALFRSTDIWEVFHLSACQKEFSFNQLLLTTAIIWLFIDPPDPTIYISGITWQKAKLNLKEISLY